MVRARSVPLFQLNLLKTNLFPLNCLGIFVENQLTSLMKCDSLSGLFYSVLFFFFLFLFCSFDLLVYLHPYHILSISFMNFIILLVLSLSWWLLLPSVGIRRLFGLIRDYFIN